jgi:hypothetical protein
MRCLGLCELKITGQQAKPFDALWFRMCIWVQRAEQGAMVEQAIESQQVRLLF